jgi:protein-tyrosine phosphatase
MLGNFFKSKKLKNPADISGLITDMHSHLIPGVDDGSPDMETSLTMIREMKALGYRKLITTPHISSDFYPNTPEILHNGLSLLNDKLREENIRITIEVAAEYMIDDGFTRLFNKGLLQTFSNNFLLVELPYYQAPPNLYEITFDLQIKGYRIMLAHPERYLFWLNDFKKFEDLKNRGVYFQMNINSLGGYFSKEVKKQAEKLIDADMIDFLGSDMHNLHYLQLLKNSLFEPYLEKVIKSGSIQNHLL